jgi:SAM-dependent methyltransferase
MTPPSELRCIVHGAPLAAADGAFECAHGCRTPIVNGIPRFVDSSFYAAAFGRQWKTHPRTQLDSETGVPISRDRLTRCLGGTLDVVRGRRVLEVGCGAGRFTEILQSAGASVLACDLSDAVEVNVQNCGGRPGYFACQADILRLPVAPAAFEVVVALGVVQHTPDPEAAIAALAAAVRPGGLLVLDHYTVQPRDTWYFRLLGRLFPRSLVRALLLRLPPPRDSQAATALAQALLPLHRLFWREGAAARLVRRVLRKLSPLADYYDRYPQLGPARLAEWSVLDTHDALTDRYKHLRNVEQIRAALAACGLASIEASYGGNGVEARARRPEAAAAQGVA